MPIVKEQDYLEHYGRLGMKWYQHIYGEADGRAKYNKHVDEKVSQYKQKETTKLANRRGKEIARLDKKINKIMYKDGYPGDTEEFIGVTDLTQMQFDRVKGLVAKRESIAKAWIAESAVIKNMTADDVKKEKQAVAKAWVADALISAATVGAAATGVSPVAMFVWPNEAALKTKRRLSPKS